MSTHDMQWKADIEAKISQLTAQNSSLVNHIKAQPNLTDVLQTITEQLSRMDQGLREDFIGKFAGLIMPATDAITNRIVKLEDRLSKAEEQEQQIEGRMLARQTKINAQLGEAEKKQIEIVNWFVEALEKHRQINLGTLAEQQAAAKDCRTAVAATAKAASLCTTFAKEYQAVSKQAGTSIQRLSTETQSNLNRYLGELKRELRETVEPVMRRVRELTEQQYLWRLRFIAVGLVAGIAISSGVAWVSQPSAFTQMQASQWSNWQSESFTQDQAERLNKLFAEFEKENSAKEAQERKK